VKETSKMQTAFSKDLNLNILESNLMKQHWALSCNLSGASQIESSRFIAAFLYQQIFVD